MAEVAVSFLLDNLTELLREQYGLVNEAFGEIRTEFRLMLAYLQSVDTLDNLPEDANDCIEATRQVVRRAEDLIETYAKTAAESSLLKQLIQSWKKSNIATELILIKDEIVRVTEMWRDVDLENMSYYYSERQRASCGVNVDSAASSAMEKLRATSEVDESLKWIKDELRPLHDFLQRINGRELELGERQKLWIRELEKIFQFVDQSLPSSPATVKIRSTRQSLCWKIRDMIFEVNRRNYTYGKIKDLIFELYRRYYTYGCGEIQLHNGLVSVVPRIRMGSISRTRRSSRSMVSTLKTKWRRPTGTESASWLIPKDCTLDSLRVDLELMKALVLDARKMGADLDERTKIWINQLEDLSRQLEAVLTDANISPAPQLEQIRIEIHHIALRKMTYGIDGAFREVGLLGSIAANSFEYRRPMWPFLAQVNFSTLFLTKSESRKQAESVQKEWQLMQGLLHDASTMENIDERLKVWLEEMQGLAHEANTIIGHQCQNCIERIKIASRVNQINYRIRLMSKWKHMYDIQYAKTRSCSRTFDHNLEVVGSYPSKDLELELMKKESKLMQALARDVKNMDKLNRTQEAWFEEMCDIGEYVDRLISRYRGKPSLMSKFLPTDQIDEIRRKLRRLSERRITYSIELGMKLPQRIVLEIKEKLLLDQERPSILPIFGMTHRQKEALRELIGADIGNHFDWHAWVYVPEEFSATSIAKKIIEQQQKAGKFEEEGTPSLEVWTEDELMRMLEHTLVHKKFLLVLDEIKTTESWIFLERAFKRSSGGSRIILVTHEHIYYSLKSTCDAVVAAPPVDLREVSRRKTDQSVPSYLMQCLFYFALFPANFNVPARRLLVLWAAEGLVRPKNDGTDSVEQVAEGYLEELIDRRMVEVERKLNGKVKSCRLREETRDTWLKQAKESRFFQDATGRTSRLVDYSGISESCFIRIHGNTPSFNTASVRKNYSDVISFLSFENREGSKPGEDIGSFLKKCISLRCFLRLRVLDLENVFRPKLSGAIGKLTRLRYLGLRWTYLETLPLHIYKLLNLQVLDVKHTYISILPTSIWKMRYLRHLYLSETFRTRFPEKTSRVSLPELQTLWGAFIDEDTAVKGGLDTALNVRKLGLSCKSKSSSSSEPFSSDRMMEQLKAVDSWISNLEHLETLRLKSIDQDGSVSDLHLSPFSGNKKLTTVYLLGLLQPSVVFEFPRDNLTDITLSGSGLTEDPMESLGRLPNLLILRLLAQSVMCTTMHSSHESFPKLKVLKLWMLENLNEWKAEEGAFPSLEDLEIRKCINLQVIPDALGQCVDAATLKKIKLTGMPPEVKIRQPELWVRLKPVLEDDQEQI